MELSKNGGMTVTELTLTLKTNHKVLIRHLEVLEAAGIITTRWVGRMRFVKLADRREITKLVETLRELDKPWYSTT